MPYKYDWSKIATAAVAVLVVYMLYKTYVKESFGLRHSNIKTAYDPVPMAQMQGAPPDYPVTVAEGVTAPHNVPYSTLPGTATVAPVVKSCLQAPCIAPRAITDVGAWNGDGDLMPANEVDNHINLHPY